MEAFKNNETHFKCVSLEAKNVSSDSIPSGKCLHKIVYFDDSIYSFGGYSQIPPMYADRYLKELWKFNLSSQTWEKIPLRGESPPALAGHTAQFMMIPKKSKIPFSTTSSKTEPKLVVYGGHDGTNCSTEIAS